MKKISALLVAALSAFFSQYANAQAVVPNPFHLDSLATLPAATVLQLHDSMRAHIDVSDTGEGGPIDHLNYFTEFWSARALANDSTGTNMFSQYYKSYWKATAERIAAPCSDNAQWQPFGVKSLDKQDLGKINAVWADTGVDSNYILAAASGGLFKTANGGTNWYCITDNTPVAGGIAGVNNIAVNPLNHNTIFLGTGVQDEENFLEYAIVNAKGYGAGILESFDGGNSWTQEFINHNNFDDTVSAVQDVFFSPGSARIYAFVDNHVFTRANNPPGTWQDITPPMGLTGNERWTELEFVPGDPNHFFITDGDGLGYAGVYESTVAVPTGSDWVEISAGLLISFPDTTTLFNRIALSAQSSDTLCAAFMNYHNSKQTALLKYNITGSPHSWIRPSTNTIPWEYYPSGTKLRISVSQANPLNIYCGSDVPSQSVDGGKTFTVVGDYAATNNHSDVRGIYVQTATMSSHGINDIVLFANDGGVSKKPAGNDATVLGSNTVVNINGAGLVIGEAFGIDMGENDKYMVCGEEHNGFMSYEKDASPSWINLDEVDASAAAFNNKLTRGVVLEYGYPHKTEPYGPRQMGASNTDGSLNDGGDGFTDPLFVDSAGNEYMGTIHLRQLQPDSTNWVDVGTPARFGLINADSASLRAFAFNPYAHEPIGYVLFEIKNGHQHFEYRNPAIDGSFHTRALPATLDSIAGGSSYPMNCVAMDPQHIERVWVGMGGINNGNSSSYRVQYSNDGGLHWYDVSAGLPLHMPVSKLVYQEGSNMLFCATDVGIYKCDFSSFDTSASNNGVAWQCFNQCADGVNYFPNVFVTDLKINYCQGKLYASTYGRGIWESQAYPSDDVPGATDSIMTNTTWSKDRFMHGSVVVTSGHSLTIDSGATIHMPRNGYILVTPNATLTVNGATITNDCDNCMWKGILCDGNSYATQTSSNQPTIILTDATIEHARRGVMNFPESLPNGNFTHAGAIIHAHNTHFLNCAIGAAITVYEHNLYGSPAQPYDAYFTDCIFEVNGNYRGHNISYPFYAGATLAGVQGVKFGGCQFYNRDDNAQNHGKGYGIYCYDAGANIYSTCTGISIPCTSWQRTKFTGFGTGIKVDGTLTPYYTLGVDGADFDSCTIGIKADHFNGVTTTHSTFKIGDGTPLELLDGDCHQNIGIWHRYCEAFGVEDNTFNGYTYTGQPSDMQNIGVIVENSALPFAQQNPMAGDTFATTFHNEVYKDSFTSLTKACWALGPNAAGNNLDDNGLVYKCNTFVDNDSAIIVNGGLAEGIAYFQGHTGQSNGNIYSSSGGHNNYIKNTARGFWYYHHGGAEAPNSLSSVLQIAVSTASAGNSCGDHYGSLPWDNTGIAIGKTAWHGLKTRVDSLKGVYNGLIDCGDAAGLHAYVDTMTSDSAIAVSNMLLSCSPYLSRYIVAHVANMDILSSSQLMHILFANPDLLHDSELIRFLAHDIPHRLSSGDMISLNDSATNTTARTAMASQIAELSDSLGWIGNLLMASMKDSTYTDVDSIPKWLYNMHSEYADYDVVGYYYSRGQLDSAAAVLGRIPARYGYDSLLTVLAADTTGTVVASLNLARLRQVLNYQGYTIIYGILTDLAADSLSLDSLSDSQLHLLNTLASEGDAVAFKASDIASGIINRTSPWQVGCAIIRIDDGYADTHLGDKPGRDSNKGNVGYSQLTNYFSKTEKGNSKSKAGGEMLTVYPNPASDYVTFDYNVQNLNGKLSLRISDTKGVLLQRFDISSRQGQIRWETRGIAPGVYFYQLSDAQQTIKSGKVTILR